MPIDSAGRPGASRITNFVFDTLIGSTVRTLDRIDLVLGDNDGEWLHWSDFRV